VCYQFTSFHFQIMTSEERIEVTIRRRRRRKRLLEVLKEKRTLETAKGSISLHSVENSLWTRLWTCKTDKRLHTYEVRKRSSTMQHVFYISAF